MQGTARYEVGDPRSLPEGPTEADEGPFHERRRPRFLEIQEPAHLLVEASVGEGVGRELVAEEVTDDPFGVGDGVQRGDSAS